MNIQLDGAVYATFLDWQDEGSLVIRSMAKDREEAPSSVSLFGFEGEIDWRQTAVSAGSGSGGGDVTGPSSATDNAIALFDGATGKVIKESALTITTGVIAGTGLELTSPIINTILTATGKTGATFTEDGAVDLYHNEIKRLETAGSGITVTGGVGATTMDTTAGNEWTAQQGFNESALTSAASTAWNCDTKQCALLTLGHNATIAAPTNQQAGTTYQLRVVQAAGLYTLAWNAVFKWGAAATPVAPAASGDVVIFSFYSDGTNMYGTETNRTEA